MNIVDSKSSQMNEVLMFRTHLVEHFAWRRTHHGNPSPATWSRRRLHDPISRTRWQPHRSNADQRVGQRRPLRWPVRQTALCLSQTPSAHDFGSPRTDHPSQRQLSTIPELRYRHVHPPCTPPDRDNATDYTRSPVDSCSRTTTAGNGHAPSGFGSVDQQHRDHRSSSNARRDTHTRGYPTPASHRSCASRPAPTASRTQYQPNFVPYSFITHGGGL